LVIELRIQRNMYIYALPRLYSDNKPGHSNRIINAIFVYENYSSFKLVGHLKVPS
jgi:hypothetical protein